MATTDVGTWRIQKADAGLKMLILRLIVEAGVSSPFVIIYPWLMSYYVRTWANRLIIDGRRVRYTGSATAVIGMWVRVVLLSIVTLTLCWWLRGRGAVKTYMDNHLEWADAA